MLGLEALSSGSRNNFVSCRLRTNTSWEDIPVTSCVLVSLWFAVACVCECCDNWEGRLAKEGSLAPRTR